MSQMDRIEKLQILDSINSLDMQQLMHFINSGKISLGEMQEHNLDPAKVRAINESFKVTKDKELEYSQKLLICQGIEHGRYGLNDIQNFLNRGEISQSDLLQNTSLTSELINRIITHKKTSTNFDQWDDDIQVIEGRTDIFFFGLPGSGKSSIMASLIHYFVSRGLMIENRENLVGAQYRDLLGKEFQHGILPDSTSESQMVYMPLELRNTDQPSRQHPLNIIEMSGEVFRRSYENGIDDKLRAYLSTKNQKILFFIIDYNWHTGNLSPMGEIVDQQTLLTGVLTDLDRYGTLNKTDAVFVLVTKSDLFPSHADKMEYCKRFIDEKYLNFIVNLKELKEKYSRKSDFELKLYPYSIGEVKFKELVVNIDYESPEFVTRQIQKFSFFKERKRGLTGLFR